VRWWAFGGPNDLDNGLRPCSLHHKLFDKGAFDIGDGNDNRNRIVTSQCFVGRGSTAREHVIALADRPLIDPQPGALRDIAVARRSGTLARPSMAPHGPATTDLRGQPASHGRVTAWWNS